MTEPRRIEPVTFLQSADAPVTRSNAMSQHPAGGAPAAEVLSFKDYYRSRQGEVPAEPTEEQLAFRRHVSGSTATEPAEPAVEPQSNDFPDDDIPEV